MLYIQKKRKDKYMKKNNLLLMVLLAFGVLTADKKNEQPERADVEEAPKRRQKQQKERTKA
jgi:hypothetical protein